MPTVHWHFPKGEGSIVPPLKTSQSKEQDVTLNTTEKSFSFEPACLVYPSLFFDLTVNMTVSLLLLTESKKKEMKA